MTNQQVTLHDRAKTLASFLESRKDDFASVSIIDPDRFLRVVKNAVLRDEKIAEASKQSVFLECQKAISDGLVLDGREAALTRFKARKQINGKWETVTEVVYIPMVQGIIKRARNSGEILSWVAELVYEAEVKAGMFKIKMAPVPEIYHDRMVYGDKGPIVGAYSAVRLRDGSVHYEWMDIDQLDAIKNRTKSKKIKTVNNVEVEEITGPWASDPGEMYRKTVMKRHAKKLPSSSEKLEAYLEPAHRVDALYDMDADEYNVEGAQPSPEPAAVANARKQSAGAKLRKLSAKAETSRASKQEEKTDVDHFNEAAHDAAEEEAEQNVDEETGEVLEGEIVNDGGDDARNVDDEF